MSSTAQQTNDYIDKHPYIKHCLQKGLINYSALARHIAEQLALTNKTSKEAIQIAARRKEEQLQQQASQEREIAQLLADSQIQMRNKISVLTTTKNIDASKIQTTVLRGTNTYTLIAQTQQANEISKELSQHIISRTDDLVEITITSPQDIENIPGVVAYLTSLFAENGVNIQEFLSCYTDTTFIIDSDDLHTALSFLSFQNL